MKKYPSQSKNTYSSGF